MLRSPIWESIRLKAPDPEQEIYDRLKETVLFNGIPTGGLKKIRQVCHLREFNEKEHIFRVGEPGVGLYVILEGSVEIYRDEEGKHFQFAKLGPGEFFGELALFLDQEPRTASAVATTFTRTIGLFKTDFPTIVRRDPRMANLIYANITQLLGRRLILTNNLLEKHTKHREAIETASE